MGLPHVVVPTTCNGERLKVLGFLLHRVGVKFWVPTNVIHVVGKGSRFSTTCSRERFWVPYYI